MSVERPMPSETVLVEAIRWLLQLDMIDPKNRRPEKNEVRAGGQECGQGENKG